MSALVLIDGAFFHMIPAGIEQAGNNIAFYVWIFLGFCVFFALEQFLHWHHCHRATSTCREPLTYFIFYKIDVAWHIPFAAGKFLYIGASDLGAY